MRLLQRPTVAALALAYRSHALSTFNPLNDGPLYTVAVPSSSSISSSTAGAIYFQLQAPTTYQWVGLGIGGQMAGASIFVMYADGNGNVTISARDGGQGHVQPSFDSSLMQGVELLAGSGVVDNVMTANVRCTTCKLSSAANSKSSPWIAAWQPGNALDSGSTSATITQHAADAMRQFTFDLTGASISSDTNPFTSAAATSSSPSSAASSGSSPSSSGSPSTSSGSSGSSSGSSVVGASFTTLSDYEKAHGIIMGVTIVLLFPIGAIFMRVVASPLFHGILQIFSLCALIVGFGLGVHLAKILDLLYKSRGRTHTIFGTVIIALFLIQPFLGLAHHTYYKKHQSRHAISHVHIWFGRIVIILGMINGGLGLKLAGNTKGGEIAYGVVAGVVAVIYAATAGLKRKGTRTAWGGREKVADGSSSP